MAIVPYSSYGLCQGTNCTQQAHNVSVVQIQYFALECLFGDDHIVSPTRQHTVLPLSCILEFVVPAFLRGTLPSPMHASLCLTFYAFTAYV